MTRVEQRPRADPQAEAAGLSPGCSPRKACAGSSQLGLPGHSDLCPGDMLHSRPFWRSWQPPSTPWLLSAGSPRCHGPRTPTSPGSGTRLSQGKDSRAQACSNLVVMRTMSGAGCARGMVLCLAWRQSVFTIALPSWDLQARTQRQGLWPMSPKQHRLTACFQQPADPPGIA